MEFLNIEALRVEVAKLYVKPGDVVVLKVLRPLTKGDSDRLTSQLKAVLPDKVQCLVLDAGASIMVVTPEEIEPQ